MEAGTAVLVEVALQLFGVFNDVHSDEGDAAGQRVGLLSTLNEDLIQVKAQEVNFAVV